MNLEKTLKLIRAHQYNLPIVLRHTKKSQYIETAEEMKKFYISSSHQTDKHLFRRSTFKAFL